MWLLIYMYMHIVCQESKIYKYREHERDQRFMFCGNLLKLSI